MVYPQYLAYFGTKIRLIRPARISIGLNLPTGGSFKPAPAGAPPSLAFLMAPPTPEELEAEIILLISDSQATNYFAVAGLVVVLLEHISNFGDEVDLVWKTGLSISNVFYRRHQFYAKRSEVQPCASQIQDNMTTWSLPPWWLSSST
ncbi:hypothetical protein C8J57DRAFT_1477610 [Mycena rebaudengoi]|nr:hypothetical protein C8J57DRAFT_1477610 [Mycena rebaudengoi]